MISRGLTWATTAFLCAVILAGVFAPWLGYDPVADVDPLRANLPSSATDWLGTDHLGRDIAWRLLLSTSAFVGPGIAASLVAALLGVPAGAWAGFKGGWIAAAVRYAFGTLASLPRVVLILLVMSIYGNHLGILSLAAGVTYAPIVGESVYHRVADLRHADYVVANRAYGLTEWRILWVHLVYALCGRSIVQLMLRLFGAFLTLETTLSYIGGFGVREPQPSWGNMLVFEWGRGASAAPAAIAIVLTVLAIARTAHVVEIPRA